MIFKPKLTIKMGKKYADVCDRVYTVESINDGIAKLLEEGNYTAYPYTLDGKWIDTRAIPSTYHIVRELS